MSASSAPRRRILDAASQLFLQNGYRVSMDEVARRADVSKQTVYTHFHSKDTLFRAAVEEMVTPLHASLERRHNDIEGTLQNMARIYSRYTGNAATTALGRMLVAEAPRFPRAARQLYQSGAGAVLDRLSTRIAQSMHRGELRCGDPDQAAELFLSMLNGMNSQRSLLGLPRRGRKAQDTWATHAVQVFLRAYRLPSPSPSTEQPSRTSP